jgi:vancomycin permeability regulator SanA
MTSSPSPVLRPFLRDAGVAVGLFGFINVVGEFVRGPFDILRTFVGVPEFAYPAALPLELLVAIVLVIQGIRPIASPRMRQACAAVLGLVALFSLVDIFTFYQIVSSGRIETSFPIPSSILVCAFFAILAIDVRHIHAPETWSPKRIARFVFSSAIVTATLPLLLMFTFGPTNYAREADCAVIFGARVWDDGTPSLALSDRVEEGIRQYQRGLVKKLVMSGAIDRNNGFSEPEVMKKRAVSAGVKEADVLLDEAGVDTSATVKNTADLMKREGFTKALAVSHYYHEPRVKMLFSRAHVRVYTVPAKMTRRLMKEPYFIAREIAAYYHSWLFQ